MTGNKKDVDERIQTTLNQTFWWYQQADTKAQVALGLSGLFLSIFVGAIISLDVSISQPTVLASAFGVMICHLLVIGITMHALWSRGVWLARAPNTAFFANIARYETAASFRAALTSQSDDALANEMADSVLTLSRNTLRKHQNVDVAIFLLGLSMLLTVGFAVLIGQ